MENQIISWYFYIFFCFAGSEKIIKFIEYFNVDFFVSLFSDFAWYLWFYFIILIDVFLAKCEKLINVLKKSANIFKRNIGNLLDIDVVLEVF